MERGLCFPLLALPVQVVQPVAACQAFGGSGLSHVKNIVLFCGEYNMVDQCVTIRNVRLGS